MTPEELKSKHDLLQVGLPSNKMCIRDGIVVDVGTSDYPRFGFEFFCWRSPEMKQELDLFIKYANGKSLMLDIGAFHGIFSLVFNELNSNGEVFAFEPMPEAYSMLCENVAFKENIYTSDVALTDFDGHISMKKEWGHFVTDTTDGGFMVKCIRGDEFIDNKTNPDIIKIDTEGSELQVLMGLSRVIYQSHPIIFLELHPDRVRNYGHSVEQICAMLESWGYRAIDTRTQNEIKYSDIEKITGYDIRLVLI